MILMSQLVSIAGFFEVLLNESNSRLMMGTLGPGISARNANLR